MAHQRIGLRKDRSASKIATSVEEHWDDVPHRGTKRCATERNLRQREFRYPSLGMDRVIAEDLELVRPIRSKSTIHVVSVLVEVALRQVECTAHVGLRSPSFVRVCKTSPVAE